MDYENNIFNDADDIYQTKRFYVKTTVTSTYGKNGGSISEKKTYIPKNDVTTKHVVSILGVKPRYNNTRRRG